MDALLNWLADRQQRGVRHAAGADGKARSLVASCLSNDRFGQGLGIELVSAGTGSVTLRMQVRREHMNFNRRCHGGAIFSLGDMALGLACNSHGQVATLVDGQMSISTAVEEGEWLVAQASEVSRSRKIGNYQVKITRARDDAHVALLHGTVYVLDRAVEVSEAAAA